MPPFVFPKWAPKDKAAPLKDEYLSFYREATQYHDRVAGNLDLHPDLSAQLPDTPEILEIFTDKIQIMVALMDLTTHLYEVRSLYEESIVKNQACTASTTLASATVGHSTPLKM